MFSLWLYQFLPLSTLWKEMGTVEKEGSLAFLDTTIYSPPPPPPTADIIAQLGGKICANLSSTLLRVIAILSLSLIHMCPYTSESLMYSSFFLHMCPLPFALSSFSYYTLLLLTSALSFQGINFYTQLKTVTQMWRETDVTPTQSATAMPVMR